MVKRPSSTLSIPRTKRPTKSVRLWETTYAAIAQIIKPGENVVTIIDEAIKALARKRAKDQGKTE